MRIFILFPLYWKEDTRLLTRISMRKNVFG